MGIFPFRPRSGWIAGGLLERKAMVVVIGLFFGPLISSPSLFLPIGSDRTHDLFTALPSARLSVCGCVTMFCVLNLFFFSPNAPPPVG